MGNVVDVRREMTKTKEQLEEEKKISLSIRIRPLELDGMDSDDLKTKAKELWELIVKLETERYDLEERTRRQDYDVTMILTEQSGPLSLVQINRVTVLGLVEPYLECWRQGLWLQQHHDPRP